MSTNNIHFHGEISKISILFRCKNALFRAMHLPVLNFQQVHFTTRWCVEKLLYVWQTEYSLIRSSVLIWVYTACPGVSVPISGHIQQTTNWWYFSYSSQKTGFDISCKLSPLETICMKCQNMFFGENKKNISKCCLLKFLPRVLSDKSRFSHALVQISNTGNGNRDRIIISKNKSINKMQRSTNPFLNE